MANNVVLDTGPLGMVTNPRATPETARAQAWLIALISGGITVIVPEIADYEVRRELIRSGKTKGIQRLDALARQARYLPLTTAAMQRAALLWAQVRQQGQPTAPPDALDGDVILAAQTVLLTIPEDVVIVATTNVRHIARFVRAEEWHSITPESFRS